MYVSIGLLSDPSARSQQLEASSITECSGRFTAGQAAVLDTHELLRR